jgi:hypothetical protein
MQTVKLTILERHFTRASTIKIMNYEYRFPAQGGCLFFVYTWFEFIFIWSSKHTLKFYNKDNAQEKSCIGRLIECTAVLFNFSAKFDIK